MQMQTILETKATDLDEVSKHWHMNFSQSLYIFKQLSWSAYKILRGQNKGIFFFVGA